MQLFELFYSYYYLVLILQGICIFHAYRRGNIQKWIWLLVFLPFIGCMLYLYSEILTKKNVGGFQANMSTFVNPTGRIKDLEKEYQFADTFTNLVRLADAYLASKQYEKAIALYEKGLTGTFSDNEHVMKQMMVAYYHLGEYGKVCQLASRVKHDPTFTKSEANRLLASSLEMLGKNELAEQEYKAMNHRYSNYEARFKYGEFLQRMGRGDEALALYGEINKEAQHMNRREKGEAKAWIDKAIESYRKG